MKKVYLIGNAHIDPVWLWKKQEGLSEIKATFRSALDRMKEFPDFVFTCACASYYEWIEQIDSEMFEEIKQRIAEGRWEIAGGMWIQPDCNLPSGEAFVRHILYSQLYLKEKFGTIAKFGYNVDSFGHNGMLPQILKKGGMDYYVFMRPEIHENTQIPENSFYWQSPDGSRVLAHRLMLHYGDTSSSDSSVASLHPCSAKAVKLAQYLSEKGLPCLCFYGVGNHGGGPTIRGLEALDALCREREDICYSSVIEYFYTMESSERKNCLPIYSGDLQHHASGCYSALSRIKKANRNAESALAAAEKMDWIASKLLSLPNHKEQIKAAWKKVMFNQFHDILAGCCIKDAYQEAEHAFAAAEDAAAEIRNLALQRISLNIRTTDVLSSAPAQKNGWVLWEKSGEGAPVAVFNPLSIPVASAVQLNVKVSKITDAGGQSVPIQYVRGPQTNGSDRENTIFIAQVPALGYSLYYLYKDAENPLPFGETEKTAEPFLLENEYLRIKFDEHTGGIESFYDKLSAREYAENAMAAATVIDDTASDTWAHGIFSFDKSIGRFEKPKFQWLDHGSVRTAIRITTYYNESCLIQDFILYADKRELEVHCKLDFHEKWKIVKLSFPLQLNRVQAIYSMPYGFLAKEADGLEEPAQEWTVLAEKDSEAGFALVNDCKHSFSCKNAELRMIIARGTAYADHFGERDDFMEFQDQGEQEFCYKIMPCSTHNLNEVIRSAAQLHQPLIPIMETHHDGVLPPTFTGICISASNVLAEVIKTAEYSDGTILRLYETDGQDTEAAIDIPVLNCHFRASLKRQEIKTFYIPCEGGMPVETDLLELQMN